MIGESTSEIKKGARLSSGNFNHWVRIVCDIKSIGEERRGWAITKMYPMGTIQKVKEARRRTGL